MGAVEFGGTISVTVHCPHWWLTPPGLSRLANVFSTLGQCKLSWLMCLARLDFSIRVRAGFIFSVFYTFSHPILRPCIHTGM